MRGSRRARLLPLVVVWMSMYNKQFDMRRFFKCNVSPNACRAI